MDFCPSVDVCVSVNICLPPQSTARQASEYASCFVSRECTNRLYVCLMPHTDV